MRLPSPKRIEIFPLYVPAKATDPAFVPVVAAGFAPGFVVV